MKQTNLELDRRSLLKGAAAGAVGAGAALTASCDAEAQNKNAVKDPGIITEMVQFKNGADTINGFVARPKGSAKHGAVIVIPGIFGLDNYIKETTSQLAQAGLVGLAVDFYSRKPLPANADFAVLRPFVAENAPDKQIVGEAQAAVDFLKKQDYANGKFGITGFCMGGRITLLTAAMSPDIRAASPYYGPVRAAGPSNIAPFDHVSKIKAVVQGHYGATDMNPKPEDVKAFYEELKKANPHAEYFIYEGAGHAFHTYDRPSYNAEVATAAWRRTTELFQKTLM